MRRAYLFCLWLAAATAACSPAPAAPRTESCGNGSCGAGESVWSCAADCPARCGDGLCSHGEACASCASDCDCALAATPPMGWNTWNKFGCSIDETLARESAQALVDSGMRDAGYRYLNLDDCWQTSRGADGSIIADPVKFAGGMAALAKDVHARELKFGVYTCVGDKTCAGRPGSKDHEAQDMATYAGWGVDYVKVDWCYTDGLDARSQYALFHAGIQGAGRQILLSLCNWGLQDPWLWGAGAGEVWRTSLDISDNFFSVVLNLQAAAAHAAYAGPGHWNDPDMLEVGNGGMSEDEDRSHMSLWAILSAPLIAGCDLRTMSATTKAILTNPEVIAINQDALGLQGVRTVEATDTTAELWQKPLAQPGWQAVVVFNPADVTVTFDLAHADVGLASPATDAAATAGSAISVRDVWSHSELGPLANLPALSLAPHTSRMFVLRGQAAALGSGELHVSQLPVRYVATGTEPLRRDQPMTLRGQAQAHGIQAHAGSVLLLETAGRCTRLSGVSGVDDSAAGSGSVAFEIWLDGKRAWQSGLVTGKDAVKPIDLDVSGRYFLKLVTTAGNDTEAGDVADWGGLTLTCP